jgi:hypothetical protein
VRFEVLMAASMKMAVFLDVAPCILVEVYFGKFLPDYKAQQPRRQLSSTLTAFLILELDEDTRPASHSSHSTPRKEPPISVW